ncbi:MAG: hypothetical protein HQL40_04830 [Alphaproteobacteria bacterium]|nr:hypothetical protein [Alphaproteobacteria bacterium]
MLGLLSALFLRATRAVTIEGFWYGAFDMGVGGCATALRLDQLLDVGDWVGALTALDRTGDYTVFEPLLARDGVRRESRDTLLEAGNWGRLLRADRARKPARGFLEQTRDFDAGASGLFMDTLRQRIAPMAMDIGLDQRQVAMAREHLRRGDLLRSVLAACEAFVTGLVTASGGHPGNALHRLEAQKDWRTRVTPEQRSPFQTLKNIRNGLAHLSEQRDPAIEQALNSPAELGRLLEELYQRLWPQ